MTIDVSISFSPVGEGFKGLQYNEYRIVPYALVSGVTDLIDDSSYPEAGESMPCLRVPVQQQCGQSGYALAAIYRSFGYQGT
eukprot:COSAG02_NODE_2520_length_8610_cov_4.542474_6_plen_82_part_00